MKCLDGDQRGVTYFRRYHPSSFVLTQAFVEFFTNEKQWQKILDTIKGDRCISFYAGNNKVDYSLVPFLTAGWVHDEYGRRSRKYSYMGCVPRERNRTAHNHRRSILLCMESLSPFHLHLTSGRSVRNLGRMGQIIPNPFSHCPSSPRHQRSILASKYRSS